MSRWFRMYDELLDDPKVQRLSGEDFKAWVNLLCLASRNDGALPSLDDIAFALRVDAKKARIIVDRLVSVTLLDAEGDRFTPHGWNARQYKSDVSTERVKRFRKRSKQQDGTPPETPPDTEAETEVPFSNENGSVSDPGKTLFDVGVAALMGQGVSQSGARSFLAKWQKDRGDAAALEALNASIGSTDIRSRMTAILGGKRASTFEFAGGPC